MTERWKYQIGTGEPWVEAPSKFAALRDAMRKKNRKKRRTFICIVPGAGTVGYFIIRSGHKRPRDDRDLFGDFSPKPLTKAASPERVEA